MKLYINDMPILQLSDNGSIKDFTIIEFIGWIIDNSPHFSHSGKVLRQANRVADSLQEYRDNPKDYLDIESEDLAIIQQAAENPGPIGYPIKPARNLWRMIERITRAEEVAKERALDKPSNGSEASVAS